MTVHGPMRVKTVETMQQLHSEGLLHTSLLWSGAIWYTLRESTSCRLISNEVTELVQTWFGNSWKALKEQRSQLSNGKSASTYRQATWRSNITIVICSQLLVINKKVFYLYLFILPHISCSSFHTDLVLVSNVPELTSVSLCLEYQHHDNENNNSLVFVTRPPCLF